MGVRLSTMKGREKNATLDWDGEAIDFAYYPNAFTMEVAEKTTLAAEANNLSVVAAMLEPIIAWWDVMDDDDVRLPPTAEVMRTFPLTFLTALMEKVGESQNPPASKG